MLVCVHEGGFEWLHSLASRAAIRTNMNGSYHLQRDEARRERQCARMCICSNQSINILLSKYSVAKPEVRDAGTTYIAIMYTNMLRAIRFIWRE